MTSTVTLKLHNIEVTLTATTSTRCKQSRGVFLRLIYLLNNVGFTARSTPPPRDLLEQQKFRSFLKTV
jgi:hypothetical protein